MNRKLMVNERLTAQEERHDDTVAAAENTGTSTPAPRILVVEDEAIVASDIQACLQSFHYQVAATASSGERALELARETLPDLVLMDIKLPGDLDGVQAAEIIHRQHGIPVVFLTANSEEEMLQRAKLVEPLAYVLKPYHERELRIAVEFALYKGKMERQREVLTRQLEQALAEAKTLRGLIPVCAWCRKIRSDQGFWLSVEAYLQQETNAVCSHGICPECLEKMTSKNRPPPP